MTLQHVAPKKKDNFLHGHIIILKIFNSGTIMYVIFNLYSNISSCPNSAFKQGSCSTFGIIVLETPLFYNAFWFIFHDVHIFTSPKQLSYVSWFWFVWWLPLEYIKYIGKNITQEMMHISHFIIQKGLWCRFILLLVSLIYLGKMGFARHPF